MTVLLPMQAIKSPPCSTRRNVAPKRGEVWLWDCGMAEKVRPVLILSIPFADKERSLVSVVFHTTALRGSQFEIQIPVPFLKTGAFVAQSIATYPTAHAIRKARCIECRATLSGRASGLPLAWSLNRRIDPTVSTLE